MCSTGHAFLLCKAKTLHAEENLCGENGFLYGNTRPMNYIHQVPPSRPDCAYEKDNSLLLDSGLAMRHGNHTGRYGGCVIRLADQGFRELLPPSVEFPHPFMSHE